MKLGKLAEFTKMAADKSRPTKKRMTKAEKVGRSALVGGVLGGGYGAALGSIDAYGLFQRDKFHARKWPLSSKSPLKQGPGHDAVNFFGDVVRPTKRISKAKSKLSNTAMQAISGAAKKAKRKYYTKEVFRVGKNIAKPGLIGAGVGAGLLGLITMGMTK
jgi:hypothetical protein